jgi:hypothetical protein
MKDLKAYIKTNPAVVGDFNTPLSSLDRSSKQKNNKEIQDLKYTIDQMKLDPCISPYTNINSK